LASPSVTSKLRGFMVAVSLGAGVSSTVVTWADVRRLAAAGPLDLLIRLGASVGVESIARLRMTRTALLPVALLALCAVPLATVTIWTLVLLVVPLVVALWVLRAGVDFSADGVTVRRLAGQRSVPWAEVAGIRVASRGALWLVTTRGTELRLPVLRARDLPRLATLTDGRIDVPAPPEAGQ
jgi:hypothetical protein